MFLHEIFTATSASPLLLLALPCSLLLVHVVYSYYRLAHIPGPFLARFTNLPRFTWVLGNNAHQVHTALHRRYGPIVRFGPNMVSVASPSEIGQIYGFTKSWLKSDFYRALLMKPHGKPLPGIFATQDEAIHRLLKKPVSNAYSMSRLVSFEPYVDATMEVFLDQLEARFVGSERPLCNLGQWLQMFAFDVIGQLTFSKRLGFLESGEDVDSVMARLWAMFQQTSLASQMPWIDPFWTNNPIKRFLRSGGSSPGAAFAMERVRERREGQRKSGKNDWESDHRDFLSRFLEIEAKDGSVPPYAVSVWASSNITAGSDTTAIVLRAILYHLLRHPDTLSKLLAELDGAAGAGNLDGLASWKQARELPYLDACIKEAGRLHPPFGLPYERVVPREGATLCGSFLPGGTVVGMSAWATHRDQALFGADCDTWNPDRWLDCDKDQHRQMENGLLTFGAGHRSCLGKHIAYLEIYKLIPTLLRRFKFELVDAADGGGDWQVENRWFVMQHGFVVRVQRRDAGLV